MSPDPLATVGTTDELSALEAAERVRLIDELRLLEELKSAVAAAQARAAAAFDASTRRAQARAGMAAEQLGRGVGAQIGLARRESAHRGNRLLGLARILTTEMPCTLRALSTGVISEWRAMLLVRETACLSRQDRRRVDEVVAGDLAGLEGLGDRGLVARVRAVAYGLDPQSVVDRAAKAVEGRYVSCRPAPDTMAYLTGLLPVAQGVGVFAVLSREADRLRAAGDGRGRGQIMADTLVERVTGRARAEDVRVEVQLIMTDRALLAGVLPGPDTGLPGPEAGVAGRAAGLSEESDESVGSGPGLGSSSPLVPEGSVPAVLVGYGVVPAQWARDLIRGNRPGTGQGSSAAGPASSPDTGMDPPDTGMDSPGRGGDSSGPGSGSGAAVPLPPGPASASGRAGPWDGRRDGPWDGSWGRPAVRPDPRTEVWLRRLYVVPETGQLVGMDSRARLVPGGLARFIAARDQMCRMPWCGAPIRHYDHVVPVRAGGRTTVENLQGLCEACNQAKEAPGWTARSARNSPSSESPVERQGTAQRPVRHTVVTTTPTGHSYHSTAPPICSPAPRNSVGKARSLAGPPGAEPPQCVAADEELHRRAPDMPERPRALGGNSLDPSPPPPWNG